MQDESDGLFDQALKFLDEEEYAAARDAFSDFIALCPESEGAYGNRGVTRIKLGEDEAALEDFRRVIELNPDDSQGYAMMADALKNLGYYDDALEKACYALEILPDEPTASFVRGWLFASCGQYSCAIADVENFAKQMDANGDVDDFLESLRLVRQLEEDGDGDYKEDANIILAEMGFSFDFSSNPDYETDDLFCQYAHCLRNMPHRSDEAPCACPFAGYDCPGGVGQVITCSEEFPET